MKFPKLRGDLTPDAAVGMKQAQALDRVDAPYLTASGPGFITRKKNGFTEVIPTKTVVDQGKPYLWALGLPDFALSNPGTFYNNDVFLSDPGKKKFKRVGNAGLLTSFSNGVYLGNKVGLIEASDTTGYPEQFKYRLATVSFKSGAPFERGPEFELTPRSLFVSGKDDAGNVQWGMAARPVSYANTLTSSGSGGGVQIENVIFGADYPCAPKIVRHTGDVVALPAEPEAYRVYFGGSVHEAGRGKLLSLVVPRDSVVGTSPAVLKQTPPFVAMSEDHGASWSRIEAPALSSLVRTVNVTAGEAYFDVQDSNVLRALGTSASFIYLGDNISLLVANGLRTVGGALFSAVFRFNSLLGVMDRVDAGETGARGVRARSMGMLYSAGVSFIPGFELPNFIEPTAMCFGRGCAAILMVVGFDYVLRVTRDFGDTWETITLPVEVGQGVFIVLSPYVDADRPGRLLMHNGTNVYQTNGLFNTFRLIGPTSRPAHATGTPVWFYKRSALHPELPGEY